MFKRAVVTQSEVKPVTCLAGVWKPVKDIIQGSW